MTEKAVYSADACDDLIAAARHVLGNLFVDKSTLMDAVLGPRYIVYGIAISKLERALAALNTHKDPQP